ncbi:1827_t:CDS:2, partial [Ambispora leptoticha]
NGNKPERAFKQWTDILMPPLLKVGLLTTLPSGAPLTFHSKHLQEHTTTVMAFHKNIAEDLTTIDRDVKPTKKKSTRKRKSICYIESSEGDHSSDLDYTEKPKRKQKSRSKRLRGKANCNDMDKGDIIVETSEDENTLSLAQSTMTSNISENTTLCEISPSAPRQSLTSLDTSEDFATSRFRNAFPDAKYMWLEKDVRSIKEANVMFASNFGERKTDLLILRLSDARELLNVEVSEPPYRSTKKHTPIQQPTISFCLLEKQQTTLRHRLQIAITNSFFTSHLPDDDISLVTEDMDEIFFEVKII